ncbi:MAG: hypothetical protein Kapaf2KO_23570 [Candidatus Kapaibacteriales bacterium]
MEYDLLSIVDQGMTPDRTISLLDDEPEERFEVTLDNNTSKYEVHIYERPVYITNWPWSMEWYDYVVLTFKDGELFRWGILDDLQTDKSEEVSELGNMINKYIAEEL